MHRQIGTGIDGRTDKQTDRQRMHGKMTDEWTDRQPMYTWKEGQTDS